MDLNYQQSNSNITPFCINTFTFILTCAQIQFKGSLGEIEQQVKKYESWNLKKRCFFVVFFAFVFVCLFVAFLKKKEPYTVHFFLSL